MSQLTQLVIPRNIADAHFPGARIRAGVLLICDRHLLLIHELSGNIGPPKGIVNWQTDDTVLAASMRALYKETGVRLRNITASPNVYMYHREHQKELLIYYPIFIARRPNIRCGHGITGYTWAIMTKCLSGRFSNVSTATSAIFRAIDSSLLFKGRGNLIRVTVSAKPVSAVSKHLPPETTDRCEDSPIVSRR